MHCKYCHTAIPSTTYICPNCGKMATKEQVEFLKDFNKNNNYHNINKKLYKKENFYNESKNIIGIILVPVVILILVVIAFIRLMTGS